MEILSIDTEAPLPYRMDATPEHEAGNIFNDAAWFLRRRDIADVEGNIREFVEMCFATEDAGDSFQAKARSHVAEDESGETGPQLAATAFGRVYLALAYSADAVRAFRAGEVSAAWTYAIDARVFMGRALELVAAENEITEHKKASVKKALDARHSESRSMKQDVFQWYRDRLHTGMTKDSAAEEMAGKFVPMKFRTVRGWLTEFKE